MPAVLGALRWTSRDWAEDIAQDLAVNVLERVQRGEGLPTAAWAKQYARWRLLDRIRAAGRTIAVGEETQPRAPGQEWGVMLAQLDKQRTELPTEQRRVFDLWLSGNETADIARLTDKPAATVRSLLRHARYSLSQRLQGEQE